MNDDSTDEVLLSLARVVQDAIDARLRALTPDEDWADQAGLRDGWDTVRDYVLHDEPGLAFAHLESMVDQPEPPLALPADAAGALGRLRVRFGR